MIVGVCSDKGSPGVSTLALALGVVWPGDRVVLEADPSGGAAGLRVRGPGGGVLAAEPSVASLAAVARLGVPGRVDALAGCWQDTGLGVPVIPGLLTAERFAAVRSLWPQIAAAVAGWPGTAVADLGRLQPGHPAAAVARAARTVLLLGTADVEGLFRLRERAGELAALLGDPGRSGPPVAVVVTGPPRAERESLRQVARMLAAAGLPVPVAGFVPRDDAAAAALWAGTMTRRLAGSELVRAARRIAGTVIAATGPALPADRAAAAGADADGTAPAGAVTAGAGRASGAAGRAVVGS